MMSCTYINKVLSVQLLTRLYTLSYLYIHTRLHTHNTLYVHTCHMIKVLSYKIIHIIMTCTYMSRSIISVTHIYYTVCIYNMMQCTLSLIQCILSVLSYLKYKINI